MNSIHLIGNCQKGGATNVSIMWYQLICKYFPDNQHLYAFCFSSADDYPWLNKYYFFTLSTLRKIVSISISYNTVFVCHTIKPQIIGLVLFLLLCRANKLVLVVHNQDDYIKKPSIKLIWRILHFFASKIAFVSRDSLQYYSDNLPFLVRNKLFIVQNGILDVSSVSYNHNQPCSFCASDDRPRFGIASRLIKQKNIPLVLDIINELEKIKLLSTFHIYGDGDESLLLPNPLNYSYVDIQIHGFCKDTRQIYSSIDVFISTSLWEGFPISPLEALSYGCFCVLSPLPQHGELKEICSTIEISKSFAVEDFMVSILNILDVMKHQSLSRGNMIKSNLSGLKKVNSNFSQSLLHFLAQLND